MRYLSLLHRDDGMDRYYNYYDYDNAGVFEILNEKLNLFNTTEIVGSFSSIIEQCKNSTIIVDLHTVTNIDSVGIGFLIAVKNICVKKGYDICLVIDRDVIIKVLKITKMESFFNIFNSIEDAVKWIDRPE